MDSLNVITKSEFKKICFQILLKKFDDAFMSHINRHRVQKVCSGFVKKSCFVRTRGRISRISFSDLRDLVDW